MSIIEENLMKVKNGIREATKQAGRNPEDILLCAVTKTRTSEEINQAIACGVTDIGENKVQEILDKYDHVAPCRWHLIGHLQTNKVKYIIDKVFLIHSVDSLKLAREIQRRCEQSSLEMNILIQVNPALEESKFGVPVDETILLVENILRECPNIRIKGLMLIAPFAEDPEEVRPYFRQVRILYQQLQEWTEPHLEMKYLSMGMSHDYSVAISEGANIVRIGTAIFGERDYSNLTSQ